MSKVRASTVTVVLLLVATTASAQSWIYDQSITDTTPQTGVQRLGASVAIGREETSGEFDGQRRVLLVGAPYATVMGLAEAGAVYVYKRSGNTWLLHATLTSNSAKAGAHFGASIATGDLGFYAVGSPDWDSDTVTDAGRVEFFRATGADSDTLIRNGQLAGGGGRLGSALAIDGEFLAVSRPAPAGSDSSCIFVYRASLSSPFNWTGIDSHCRTGVEALGSSLAIQQTSANDIILVAGAPGFAQSGLAASGNAFGYTLVGDELVEFAEFRPPTPMILDFVGTSVGINALGTVFVGATGRDLSGVGRTGSVSVFKDLGMPGYQFIQELFPASPRQAGDLCGAALAVDKEGDGFVLGCPGSDGSTANEGAARLFQQTMLNVWTQTLLSYGNRLHGSDDLGRSVAIGDNRIFVGAPLHDVAPDADHGGVEVFTNDPVFDDGFE